MMNEHKSNYFIIAFLLVMVCFSCSNEKQNADTKSQEKTPAATIPSPESSQTSKAGSISLITGKILETCNGGGYTYARMETDGGEKWVAMPESKLPVGETVSLEAQMTVEQFESKSLQKTFDELIFCSGITGSKEDSSAHADKTMHEGMMTMGKSSGSFSQALQEESTKVQMAQRAESAPMGSMGAIVPFANVNVDKAEGPNGYTIGEISEHSAELDGKKVVVRGKVMKVSPAIMGRNWIHIQDGTGDPLRNTHDLVITSQMIPEKAAVITVEGVLGVNRDFGAGYTYGVIVEDAEIK